MESIDSAGTLVFKIEKPFCLLNTCGQVDVGDYVFIPDWNFFIVRKMNYKEYGRTVVAKDFIFNCPFLALDEFIHTKHEFIHTKHEFINFLKQYS